MSGEVVAVCARKGHGVGKTLQLSIRLIAGQGVEGDAHCGEKVKHRSRVRFNPDQPNLRQVHLIHSELFDELAEKGFAISPGELGENILTSGIDLLALSTGAILSIGSDARIDSRSCETGKRSAMVARVLLNSGHHKVYVLDGHLKEWRENGRPLT